MANVHHAISADIVLREAKRWAEAMRQQARIAHMRGDLERSRLYYSDATAVSDFAGYLIWQSDAIVEIRK